MDESYSRFYTRDYFNSSLYDYSSYRLSRILELAQPGIGKRVLDLGCGPGEIAVRCAKRGAEVYGIDVSGDALELSAERCKKEDVMVHLLKFDGQRIPLKDATFDSIILSDVVEHVDDETLSMLVKECTRLLIPEGRMVIHTSPTKNIITLSRFLKRATFGGVDLHSRLVNPDYEFLHIRYHSKGSLRTVLTRCMLHPLLWGEFRYLSWTKMPMWADVLGLRDTLADQLWCLAFKDPERAKEARQDRPYLDTAQLSSKVNFGRCDELCINYGFYHSEKDGFRWTSRAASLFIEIPDSYSHMVIWVQTVNPGVAQRPVKVSIFLADRKIMEFRLKDQMMREFSGAIKKGLRPGPAELRLTVDGTFVPKELGINEDGRELGVAVHRIEIS